MTPLFRSCTGIFSALALLQSVAVADSGMAKVSLRYLEESVQKAREHPENPQWWAQCEGNFESLKNATAALPVAERAPFEAKLKQYGSEVVAGALRGRGFAVARYLRRGLESAHEDLKDGPVSDRTLEHLERDFASPDAQGIPAAELAELKADYTAIQAAHEKAVAKAKAGQ